MLIPLVSNSRVKVSTAMLWCVDDSWPQLPAMNRHAASVDHMKKSNTLHRKDKVNADRSGKPDAMKKVKVKRTQKEADKTKLFKTEMCKNWDPVAKTGCKYGDGCKYAHGLDEMRVRQTPDAYKTRICKTFLNTGSCRYGTRCRFVHGDAEERTVMEMQHQAIMRTLQDLRPPESPNESAQHDGWCLPCKPEPPTPNIEDAAPLLPVVPVVQAVEQASAAVEHLPSTSRPSSPSVEEPTTIILPIPKALRLEKRESSFNLMGSKLDLILADDAHDWLHTMSAAA